MTAENPPADYRVSIILGDGVTVPQVSYDVDSDGTFDDNDPEQVLDGLTIGWGFPNGSPWPSQPDPSYCTLRLLALDAATLAPVATEGTPVQIELQDSPGGGGSKVVTFYGRVTSATAVPVNRPSGPRTLFTLSCVDYSVDLAELVIDLDARPVESVGDRLTAIADAMEVAGALRLGSIPVGGDDLDATTARTTDALSAINDVLRQYNNAGGVGYFRRHIVWPRVNGSGVPTNPDVETFVNEIDADDLPGLLALEPTSANLVTNPGLEVNTTGWGGALGVTFLRSTADAKTGVACLQMTTTGAGGGYVFFGPGAIHGPGVGDGPACAPGDVVTGSIWAKNVNAGSQVGCYMNFHDAAGNILAQWGALSIPAIGVWTLHSTGPKVAPPLTAFVSILTFCGGGGAGIVTRFDDASLTRQGDLGITFPDSIGGDQTHGIVDGCRVPFETLAWRNNKRHAVTRLAITGPSFGVYRLAADTDRVVKLELASTLTGADIPVDGTNSGVGRMANMYLPDVAEANGWEAQAFRFMASDKLQQIEVMFPDHSASANASQWPMGPIVVTEVPDAINLAGPTGLYAGLLHSAVLTVAKGHVDVEFSLRRNLPDPKGNQAKTASYDYVEATWPTVDYDHVDPRLTYYDARLARKA